METQAGLLGLELDGGPLVGARRCDGLGLGEADYGRNHGLTISELMLAGRPR